MRPFIFFFTNWCQKVDPLKIEKKKRKKKKKIYNNKSNVQQNLKVQQHIFDSSWWSSLIFSPSLPSLPSLIVLYFPLFFFSFSNYWDGQGLQRPYFTHALEIIGVAKGAPAAPLPTPMAWVSYSQSFSGHPDRIKNLYNFSSDGASKRITGLSRASGDITTKYIVGSRPFRGIFVRIWSIQYISIAPTISSRSAK